MAGIIFSALRRLLPKGKSWTAVGNNLLFIEALSISIDRVRAFIAGVQNESAPSTADITIDLWLEMLGVTIPASATLLEKRALAVSIYTSVGGQSIDYINETIQKTFPNVFVEETDESTAGTAGVGEVGEATCESESDFTLYYYVRGFYPFASDYSRLLAVLTRVAPLHLVPVYQARSVYDGDVARCGIGSTGRSICGRSSTAYTPTAAEIGLVSVGRAGVAIVGRTA